MFSFHRPKVYRSPTGCCICKAKSSSSRFTDSKKYEEDFMECFKLAEPRQGEICNACVLLVKRWKKLPAGSDRNWKHVVDARAGPGIKSMSKFKSKHKKLMMEESAAAALKKPKAKHFEREYSPALSDKSNEDVDMAEDVDFLCAVGGEDGPSRGSSRMNSPRDSDCEESGHIVTISAKSRRQKGVAKRRREGLHLEVSDFINVDYWRKEKICCGSIFRGALGEVLVDCRYLKACTARLARCKLQRSPEEANVKGEGEPDVSDSNVSITLNNKVFCDSSSDSGYDESSNQGAANADTTFKKEVSIVKQEEDEEVLKTKDN